MINKLNDNVVEFLELYSNDYNLHDLAELCGADILDIMNFCKDNGLKWNKRVNMLDKFNDVIEFLRLNSEKYTARELSEIYNVSTGTIRRWCKDNNLKLKLAVLNNNVSNVNEDKLSMDEFHEEVVKNVNDKLKKMHEENKIKNTNKSFDDKILIDINKKYNFYRGMTPLCDDKIDICNKLLDKEVLYVIEKYENSKIKEISKYLKELMNRRNSLVDTIKQNLNNEILKAISNADYEKIQDIVEDLKKVDNL